jgi:hypothetical protein
VDSSDGTGTGTLTNTGRLEGRGTIAGNVDNVSGTVLPGDSFAPCQPCARGYSSGLITISGNFNQGPGGFLAGVILGPPGTAGASYSQLSVQGAAHLDGTLNTLTAFVAMPAAGDAYQILTARSVTGTFATLNSDLQPSSGVRYVAVYNPTNVTVAVEKIPTPRPQPPRCTLKLNSRRVKLTTEKTRHAGRIPGTLTATVVCDQPAGLKLSGTVIERLGSRHTPRTRRFRLRPVTAAAARGRATTLTVALPAAALSALRSGHREAITVTLTASGSGGTTSISTRPRALISPNRSR